MYTAFFNFSGQPFATTVSRSDSLYMTDQHRESFQQLKHAVEDKVTLALFTGEVGIGKTTLSLALLESVPSDVKGVFITNPQLPPVDFLESILDTLEINYSGVRRDAHSYRLLLQQYLSSRRVAGERTLIVIDEAQNLQGTVFDLIASLLNDDAAIGVSLSFLLVGQPELLTKLKRPRHRAMASLVTLRVQLLPLRLDEVRGYIEFRLNRVGTEALIFSPRAVAAIYTNSDGLPRLINLICHRCLLMAYSLGRQTVTAKMVQHVAESLRLGQRSSFWPVRITFKRQWLILGGMVLPALGLILMFVFNRNIGQFESPVNQAPPPKAVLIPIPPAQEPQGPSWWENTQLHLSRLGAQIGKGGDQLLEIIPRLQRLFSEDSAKAPERIASKGPQKGLQPPSPTATPSQPANNLAPSTSQKETDATTPPIPEDAEEEMTLDENHNAPDFAALEFNPSTPTTDTPEFLAWVKQGVEPTAEKEKFEDWAQRYPISHHQGQLDLMQIWIPNLPNSSQVLCPTASDVGLQCTWYWGEWELLQKINLPFLMEVRLAGGKPSQVLVRRIKDQRVTVVNEDGQSIFSVSEMLPAWTGKATIIWRPAPELASTRVTTKGRPDRAAGSVMANIVRAANAFRSSIDLPDQEKPSLLGLLGAMGHSSDLSVPRLDDPMPGAASQCTTDTRPR